MKTIITAIVLFTGITTFGQSKAELQEENTKLRTTNIQLTERVTIMEHQVLMMKKENETLRDIMRGYVYQIDSLNTRLQIIEEEKKKKTE